MIAVDLLRSNVAMKKQLKDISNYSPHQVMKDEKSWPSHGVSKDFEFKLFSRNRPKEFIALAAAEKTSEEPSAF